jgi:hypothetical protein
MPGGLWTANQDLPNEGHEVDSIAIIESDQSRCSSLCENCVERRIGAWGLLVTKIRNGAHIGHFSAQLTLHTVEVTAGGAGLFARIPYG